VNSSTLEGCHTFDREFAAICPRAVKRPDASPRFSWLDSGALKSGGESIRFKTEGSIKCRLGTTALFDNRPLNRENSALARYDVILGQSLKIPLIGNFSFERRFELVCYANKILGQTRRNFTMKLSYSFGLLARQRGDTTRCILRSGRKSFRLEYDSPHGRGSPVLRPNQTYPRSAPS
jgi:hypothetical protein